MSLTLDSARQRIRELIRERGEVTLEEVAEATRLREFTVLLVFFLLRDEGAVELVENHSVLKDLVAGADGVIRQLVEEIDRRVPASRARAVAQKALTLDELAVFPSSGEGGGGSGRLEGEASGVRGGVDSSSALRVLDAVLEELGGSAGEFLVREELRRRGVSDGEITLLLIRAARSGKFVVKNGIVSRREGWADWWHF